MSAPTTDTTVWTPTPRQLRLALEWHGSLTSMTYAIASTGALSLGSVRPTVSECEHGEWTHRPATDAEWRAELLWLLWRELLEVCDLATGRDAVTARKWAAAVGDAWELAADTADAKAVAS